MASALRGAIDRSQRSTAPRDGHLPSPLRVFRRHSLGQAEVLGQSLATVAPATGMVFVATWMAGHRPGLRGVATIAATTLVVVLAAYCVTQFTRRLAAAGGLYSFVAQALGPRATLTTAAGLLAGYLGILVAALANGALNVLQLGELLGVPADGRPASRLVPLVMVAAVAVVAVRGARFAARATLVVETCSLLLITVTMLVTPTAPGASPAPVVPDADGLGVLPMLAVLTVVSMVGFESAAFVGGEARRPLAGVTRAVMGTPLVVGAFFLLAAVVSLTGHGAVLAAAYHDGAAAAVPWAVVLAVQAGTACSWLACALGCAQASARLLWSLGADRVLPRRFTTVRAGVPLVGLGTVLVVGLVGAAGHDVLDAASSVGLATAIEIGFAVAYTLVAAASGRFLHRIGEHTTGTRAAAVAVTLGGVALLLATCGAALADGNLVVPGVLAVVIASGPVWAAQVRRRDASALRGLGAFDTVETADLLPGAGEVTLDGHGRRTVVRSSGGTGDASWAV